MSYAGRPHVVYAKSETPHWRVGAHVGRINCITGKTITYGEGGCQFFTGGEDGSVKIFDGKGRHLSTTSNFSSSAITCIVLSNSNVELELVYFKLLFINF